MESRDPATLVHWSANSDDTPIPDSILVLSGLNREILYSTHSRVSKLEKHQTSLMLLGHGHLPELLEQPVLDSLAVDFASRSCATMILASLTRASPFWSYSLGGIVLRSLRIP